MINDFYNSKLEAAIYNILCNETIFKVGYICSSTDIIKIVKPLIDKQLIANQDFNKNVHQVLETRNNCCRNKQLNNPKYVALIKRDIAVVKDTLEGPYGTNRYFFGCRIENVFNPKG